MPDREEGEAGGRFAEEVEAHILKGARELGWPLDGSSARALARHAQGVRDALSRVNLTSIRDAEGMAVRHVLDSVAPVFVWPEAVVRQGKALDLGSGGGYPGLPLAVALPGVKVTLLEATQKKVRELQLLVREVGNAQAAWGRAEDWARRGERYDQVWVRAVGPLWVVVEMGLALCTPGGSVLAWKGPEARGQEEELGAAVCRALGGEVVGARSYRLPGTRERWLYLYRRGSGALPAGVPRRMDIMRRRPWTG